MSFPALQDLFVRHRQGATGAWRLGTDPQRTIYLEQGRVIFAQSTHPLDKLTTLLVERGKLTQAQLDYALQNLKPGTSIGRNLIDMGFITQRDLLEMARSQVERVVWGAIGTPDEAPVFEAGDLDNTVVRLPMDTPFLLLMGVLHITDRERLLATLGPLDQRPDLEGRALPELPLPSDLARVAPMLDGRRSLLDLAQEAGAEPVRLGAFALFLREMGLVRLKMAEPAPPPILAFDPASLLFDPPAEPEPLPSLEPLPDPIPAPETAPEPTPLFAAIEAAQRPTVNLDHLSAALDKSAETPEELDTAAELPPAPPPPTATLRSANIPSHAKARAAAGTTMSLPPVFHEQGNYPIDEGTSKSRGWIWALLLVLLGAGAWAGYRWALAPKAAPVQATGPKPEAPKAGPRRPEGPKPEPPKAEGTTGTEAPKVEAPKAIPASDKSPASDAAGRWAVLAKGDWPQALKQGAERRASLIKEHWTLRLEVACQTETLAKAVELLKDQRPDLFLLPLAMRDGKTCTQVYMGDYPSEAEARKAAATLPAEFQAPGARPKPYPVSAIPDKQ